MTQAGQSAGAGRLLAWAVHALTASSAVLALLAFAAVDDGRLREALLWLLVALGVDGIDGTLARAIKVKERLPRIDGAALDLVVDYVTYVFVPALIIWRLGVLPGGIDLALAALILLSSLYVFARRDMKTDDGYFRGFPALWNIVALYFVVAPPGQVVAAAVVIVLVILTFAPVHVIHPFRVRDYGAWPAVVASAWGAATLALLLEPGGDFQLAALATSLVAAAILLALGLVRTARGAQ